MAMFDDYDKMLVKLCLRIGYMMRLLEYKMEPIQQFNKQSMQKQNIINYNCIKKQ